MRRTKKRNRTWTRKDEHHRWIVMNDVFINLSIFIYWTQSTGTGTTGPQHCRQRIISPWLSLNCSINSRKSCKCLTFKPAEDLQFLPSTAWVEQRLSVTFSPPLIPLWSGRLCSWPMRRPSGSRVIQGGQCCWSCNCWRPNVSSWDACWRPLETNNNNCLWLCRVYRRRWIIVYNLSLFFFIDLFSWNTIPFFPS